jgi:hypothetical protein
MGFDPMRMRMYRYLLEEAELDFGIGSLSDVEVITSQESWSSCLADRGNRFLGFKPHPGWVGHIELPSDAEEHLTCGTTLYQSSGSEN